MRLRQATVWLLSICARETTLHQMDGFALFIFVTAIKVFREYSFLWIFL